MNIDDIKAGKKFKIYYGKNNINNCKIHIRSIVDDRWIAYKQWSTFRQRWVYNIESKLWFEQLIRSEFIKEVK